MLSQLQRLSISTDCRYASDTELQWIEDYLQSFTLRRQTYLKLQNLESILVQQTYTKMRSIDPSLFHYNNTDISAKWKQDTLRVLRYTALTVLTNDPDVLCERLLFWFRTVMTAFGMQRTCDVTYQVLQEVVCQNFTVAQAGLVCSVLELNRRILGLTEPF